MDNPELSCIHLSKKEPAPVEAGSFGEWAGCLDDLPILAIRYITKKLADIRKRQCLHGTARSECQHSKLLLLYSNLVSGMFDWQNVSLLPPGDVSINLGCNYGTMAKQTLDISDVYILLQQQGCKRVAKHMWSDMQILSGQPSVFGHDIPNWLIW